MWPQPQEVCLTFGITLFILDSLKIDSTGQLSSTIVNRPPPSRPTRWRPDILAKLWCFHQHFLCCRLWIWAERVKFWVRDQLLAIHLKYIGHRKKLKVFMMNICIPSVHWNLFWSQCNAYPACCRFNCLDILARSHNCFASDFYNRANEDLNQLRLQGRPLSPQEAWNHFLETGFFESRKYRFMDVCDEDLDSPNNLGEGSWPE